MIAVVVAVVVAIVAFVAGFALGLRRGTYETLDELREMIWNEHEVADRALSRVAGHYDWVCRPEHVGKERDYGD